MNSSIALRLLWKEYRVQRGLWLSMAAGCFILQALIGYLMPSGPERLQGIVPIAFLLTGFYAIGSGAITFAIEREDGTQLRPVMLGCPPGLTLTIKTIFGIVTTTLLLVLTLGSGMLIALGSLTLPENTFPPQAETSGLLIPFALLFVALPYLGCLLWSTFFSLLIRKVIVALGLSAVAMIATYICVAICSIEIVQNSNTGQLRQPVTGTQVFLLALLPCTLALLVFGLNYLLTHRWLTRAFFDQSSSKSPSFFKRWRIRQSGLDGSMVVEIGVEDRTAFEVVTPEVALHMPPPRFGLRMLYEMWWPDLCRHLRFLRWKEAIETRKIYVGFLLATMIFVVWCTAGDPRHNRWHGPVAFLIYAVCVACGAMAFRAEQDERKVQRLADMGLRPATVWLSKHLVWLVRAIVSVGSILLCVLVAKWFYVAFWGYDVPIRIPRFVSDIWMNSQLPNSVPSRIPEVRLIGRAAILILTMYSVGQLCSQLIRSTIVSMFVAFILALTAFGWAGVCWWFDVPFILSVLPLAIGCLLVTWFRTKSWMIDDNRPRAWTWSVASLAVAISIMYFGTGLFRVYQIPWTEPFFGETASSHGIDGLTDDQRAAVLAPVTENERNTFVLYQRAADLLGKNNFRNEHQSLSASERWAELSKEDRLAAEKAIQLAVEAAESSECAEFSPATTNVADIASTTSGTQMSEVSDLLRFDAYRELEAGRSDAALDRLSSAFAVARHAAGRGGEMHWWLSNHMTIQTLGDIQKWAAHSDVDEELVGQATQMVNEHRQKMLPVEVANYASAIIIRNTLDADMFTLTELLDDSHERLPLLLATKFPGELARSHRMLNSMERRDVETMNEYRSQIAAAKTGQSSGMAQLSFGRPGNYASQLKFSDQMRLLLLTTPLLAMISDLDGDRICSQDIRTECQVRATKIVLELLLEQRESGKLPATLDGFDESLNDPWSDRPFIWYPEGLSGNLMLQNRVKVEAGTPFLLTTGSEQSTIRRVEYWESSEDGPFEAVSGLVEGSFGGDDDRLGLGSADGLDGVATEKPEAEDKQDGPAAEEKQPTEKLTRVEYVIDAWDNQPSRADIVIWQLPRNPAAKGEIPAADKAE